MDNIFNEKKLYFVDSFFVRMTCLKWKIKMMINRSILFTKCLAGAF